MERAGSMIGVPAIYAAQALATGLGVAYAWRVRSHRPVAFLIALGFALDLAQEPLGPSPSGWRFALSLSLGSAYPWAVLGVVSVSLRGEGRLGSEGASADHNAIGDGLERRGGSDADSARPHGFPADDRALHGLRHGFLRGGKQRVLDLGRRAKRGIHSLIVAGCASTCRWSHVGGGPPLRGGVGAQAAPGPTEGVAQDGGGVGDCAGGVNEDPGDEVWRDDAEQAHTRILAPLALLFTLYLASLLSSGVRGPALARCYAVAQVGLGVGMAWVVRGWDRRRRSTKDERPGSDPEPFRSDLSGAASDPVPPHGYRRAYARRASTATEIVAIICAVTEMSLVPVYLNLPHWYGARAAYATCYLLLIALHARALIGGSPCRPLTPYTSGGPRSS